MRLLNIISEMEIMDAILQHEVQEFDALVSLLEEPSPATEHIEMADYGSDDEEYTSLCIEAVAATEARHTGNSLERTEEPSDDMDTSTG